MKGNMSVVITLVILALLGGAYFGLAKPKLEEARKAQEAERDRLEQELAQIEVYKAETPKLRALLPRWREQFEIFRAAIPVTMEDDVFLRNLQQQMQQNGVKLMAVEISPAGRWFANLNEVQEANYRKENIKPEELRLVRVANFSVNLRGDFGAVLRAFENLKLYGRIYALDRIDGPAGGASGAVFLNEEVESTPIQVSGRIFYGLSENYLSQETLDKYFGRAEALGAAAAVYEAATNRSDQLAENPTAIPAPQAGAAAARPAAGAEAAPAAGADAAVAPPASAKAVSKQRVAQSGQGSKTKRQQAAGG